MGEAAIIVATGKLVFELASTTVDGIAACIHTAGMRFMWNAKRRELHKGFKMLGERLKRIGDDYSIDPDRYQMDGDIEIEQLKSDIIAAERDFPGKKSTIVNDLFSTGVNAGRFEMLQEYLLNLNERAGAIEQILQTRTFLTLPKDHPIPTTVVDPKVEADQSITQLTFTWKDKEEQMEYVAQYQVELRDISGRSQCRYFRYDYNSEDRTLSLGEVTPGTDGYCTFCASITVVHPWTPYAVRICKRYKSNLISNWCLPSKAATTTNNHPPSPEVIDNPFTSPEKGKLTIAFRRPEKYNLVNIKECIVSATSNQKIYDQPEKLEFHEDKAEEVLSITCDELKMDNNLKENCHFTFYYIDAQGQSSQVPLEKDKIIGSLPLSSINDITIELDAQNGDKLKWTPPPDNNAGAIDHYLVRVYRYIKIIPNRERRKLVDIQEVNSESWSLAELDNGKYCFKVCAVNFSGDKSKRSSPSEDYEKK